MSAALIMWRHASLQSQQLLHSLKFIFMSWIFIESFAYSSYNNTKCNYKSMNELHQSIMLIISHYVVFIYIHVIWFVILYNIYYFVNKSVYLINSSFLFANCAFMRIKYSLQFVSRHCTARYIDKMCQTFVRT